MVSLYYKEIYLKGSGGEWGGGRGVFFFLIYIQS